MDGRREEGRWKARDDGRIREQKTTEGLTGSHGPPEQLMDVHRVTEAVDTLRARRRQDLKERSV